MLVFCRVCAEPGTVQRGAVASVVVPASDHIAASARRNLYMRNHRQTEKTPASLSLSRFFATARQSPPRRRRSAQLMAFASIGAESVSAPIGATRLFFSIFLFPFLRPAFLSPPARAGLGWRATDGQARDERRRVPILVSSRCSTGDNGDPPGRDLRRCALGM